MKKYFAAAAVAASVFGAVSTATAADTTTSHGKLTRFSATDGGGRLVVTNARGKFVYRVASTTDCGVSFGQSGDQIRCKTLGKSKYKGKPVTVRWHKGAGGNRVADLVAVDLSK
jgi:hypothetical protein